MKLIYCDADRRESKIALSYWLGVCMMFFLPGRFNAFIGINRGWVYNFSYIHARLGAKNSCLIPTASIMDRRSAVKNLMVASGGLITLPFWMEACGISDKNTHQTSFSPAEQEILAKITDTIIPAGNAVGALSVGVDKFLQKLIDDCYEKPVQDNVKRQLRLLDDKTKAIYGKSFADCDQKQREEMLLKWQGSQVKEDKDFFDLMKSQTIFGFNTSQKVMQDYLHYEVAPGHYYGCINAKA